MSVVHIKLKIRHIDKYFMNPLGLSVVPLTKSNSLSGFISYLKGCDLALNHIYDVGAFKGHWTKSVGKYLPESSFYMFEPNKEHNPDLKKLGHDYFNILLGRHDGVEVDFFSAGNTGDSYYKEINPVYETDKIKRIRMRTLDATILEFGLPQPDFLKIDTQGSELDILRGATKALESAKVVIVELPISALNSGAPRIQETLEYLDSLFFTPVKVTEIHELLGVLVQIDIAFILDSEFEKIKGFKNPYKLKKF